MARPRHSSAGQGRDVARLARRLEQVVSQARLKHIEVEVAAFAWFDMNSRRAVFCICDFICFPI